MKVKQIALLGAMLAAFGLALAQDKSAPAIQQRATKELPVQRTAKNLVTAPTNSTFPIIGYIEQRDRTITIKSGPKGALYSVKNKAGKILCEDVSLEQLRAQAPDLHEFIKTAVAGSSGNRKTVNDASLGRGALGAQR